MTKYWNPMFRDNSNGWGWRAGVMAEEALISPSGLPNSGASSGEVGGSHSIF